MLDLKRHFTKIGARVDVHPPESRWRVPETVGLDVRRDKDGEYFDITLAEDKDVDVSVLNVQPEDRHLVLMVKSTIPGTHHSQPKLMQKFLCGHDERHWFVAAIPESAGVTTVEQAKQALKPGTVKEREFRVGVPANEHKRRNAAWKRQGEWFFIPTEIDVPKAFILKHEPLQLQGSKAHYAEQAYRAGGTTVYVQGDKVISESEFRALQLKPSSDSERPRGKWQQMVRDARVYVRGRITHPDHKTITLDGWHEVIPNTEGNAWAKRSVVFLD